MIFGRKIIGFDINPQRLKEFKLKLEISDQILNLI